MCICVFHKRRYTRGNTRSLLACPRRLQAGRPLRSKREFAFIPNSSPSGIASPREKHPPSAIFSLLCSFRLRGDDDFTATLRIFLPAFQLSAETFQTAYTSEYTFRDCNILQYYRWKFSSFKSVLRKSNVNYLPVFYFPCKVHLALQNYKIQRAKRQIWIESSFFLTYTL